MSHTLRNCLVSLFCLSLLLGIGCQRGEKEEQDVRAQMQDIRAQMEEQEKLKKMTPEEKRHMQAEEKRKQRELKAQQERENLIKNVGAKANQKQAVANNKNKISTPLEFNPCIK